MRFSIRWLLVATAYVALVTAAIASGRELLADAVWAASIFAVCYATAVACSAGPRPRAIAAGFVVLAVANMLGIHSTPSKTPAMRFIDLIGYTVSDRGQIWVEGKHPSGIGFVREPGISPSGFRTINAVGTLLVGIVGGVIGALAYRQFRERDSDEGQ